jgi:hypothetical protein
MKPCHREIFIWELSKPVFQSHIKHTACFSIWKTRSWAAASAIFLHCARGGTDRASQRIYKRRNNFCPFDFFTVQFYHSASVHTGCGNKSRSPIAAKHLLKYSKWPRDHIPSDGERCIAKKKKCVAEQQQQVLRRMILHEKKMRRERVALLQKWRRNSRKGVIREARFDLICRQLPRSRSPIHSLDYWVIRKVSACNFTKLGKILAVQISIAFITIIHFSLRPSF